MPITFRSSSTARSTTTSVVVDLPIGAVENDIITARVSYFSNFTVSGVPSGWNLITSGVSGVSACAAYWYKVPASPPSTFTWTISGSDDAQVALNCYSGIDTTTPIMAWAVSAQSPNTTTALVIPSLTLTAATTVEVGWGSNNSAYRTNVNGFPASWTARADIRGTAYGGATTASKEFASSGATGTANVTATMGYAAYVIVVAFNEGAGGPTSKSVTDVASGTDGTPTLGVSFGVSEALSGADGFGTRTAQFVRSDTAAFLDVISQLRNSFQRTDAMTSSDAIASLIARAVVSDQVVAGEGAVASATVTLSDVFSGAEAVSLFTGALKNVIEAGAFGDLVHVLVSPIQIVDSNSISDGILISTLRAVFDSATGTTSGITLLVSCPVSETINSIDGTQVQITLLVQDGILSSSSIALVLDTLKQVLELAQGSDNVLVSARALLTDTISLADLTSVAVSINLADFSSLSDLLLISSYLALTDVAILTDGVPSLQVKVQVADFQQGTTVLTAVSNLLGVSDLASFLDVSLAYNSVTKVVTITIGMSQGAIEFQMRQSSIEFNLTQG